MPLWDAVLEVCVWGGVGWGGGGAPCKSTWRGCFGAFPDLLTTDHRRWHTVPRRPEDPLTSVRSGGQCPSMRA